MKIPKKHIDALNELVEKYTNQGLYGKIFEPAYEAYILSAKYNYIKGKAKAACGLSGYSIKIQEYDEAIRFADESIELSKLIGDKVLESDALTCSAHSFALKGDDNAALVQYQRAMDIACQTDDKPLQYNYIMNLASFYGRIGDREMAMRTAKQAIMVAEGSEEHSTLTWLYNEYATFQQNGGDYAEAHYWYMRALEYADSEPNKSFVGDLYTSLAGLLGKLGNLKQKEEYLNRALELHISNENPIGQAIVLHCQGDTHKELGLYEQALDCYNRSFAIARINSFIEIEQFVLTKIGALYHTLGEYERAVSFFEEAMSFTPNVHDVTVKIYLWISIGDTYAALGSTEKAIEYYTTTASNSKAAGIHTAEIQSLAKLSELFEKKGDYTYGLQYAEESWQCRQDIHNADHSNRLKNITLKAELDQIQQEKEVQSIKQQAIAQELERKNAELQYAALLSAEREQMIESILKQIHLEQAESNREERKLFKELESIVGSNKKIASSTFERQFNEQFPDFLTRITAQFPSLTP
ncbi:MAG: tetratricopeptide repeat protein, partial [Ignavibacteriae bacterium]|nr:tetratricopeptide repeat protein [Ignavibacteriota bacterium]